MSKEISLHSKEVKDVINELFENNLRMENTILKIMIDYLLRFAPDETFQTCYNRAILNMCEKNKKGN